MVSEAGVETFEDPASKFFSAISEWRKITYMQPRSSANPYLSDFYVRRSARVAAWAKHEFYVTAVAAKENCLSHQLSVIANQVSKQGLPAPCKK